MVEFEILGLERKRVESLAKVYEGYGRILSDDNGEAFASLRASSLALASVYWCLLEPSHARGLFQQATRMYKQQRLPYWVVLAICGTDDDALATYLDDARKRDFVTNNLTQLFNDLLVASLLAVSPNLGNPFEYRVAGILDKGYQFAPSFVGRLPIPLRFYLSVFSTIDQLSTQKAINPIDVVGPMTSYLRRVDELFDAARTDSYHWTRLQSGILPVEPDVLAVCNVMNMACRKWFQESLLDILKDQLRPVELIPIQVAVGLTESRNLG